MVKVAAVMQVLMNGMITVFGINIVPVLMLGLLGCGCLFPSTPRDPNLYFKAQRLRAIGEYEAAIAKRDQVTKKRGVLPLNTKVIDVSAATQYTYYIAFCYAKLAESEADVSLYVKAEEVVKDSFQTAVLHSDQARVLYLWGFILFKQARYEEARTKFLTAKQTALRSGLKGDFITDILFAIGKTHLELGDETAARQTLGQLEVRTKPTRYDYKDEVLYALGRMHLQLGDEAAARRVFAQIEKQYKNYQQSGYPYIPDEVLYALGKAYLQLGDETAARRAITQFENEIQTSLQRGYPRVEDALYALGKAYLQLDDDVAARRAFGRLLEHYPDSQYKPEAELVLGKQ